MAARLGLWWPVRLQSDQRFPLNPAIARLSLEAAELYTTQFSSFMPMIGWLNMTIQVISTSYVCMMYLCMMYVLCKHVVTIH